MSNLWFYSDPIDRMHQENLLFWTVARFCPPSEDASLALAREAEGLVLERIQAMGYTATPTRRNRPFDICVEGARIEVKASQWYPAPHRGGRYQARIHHHDAEIVVFDCVNGAHHFFVIPMDRIAPRHNLAISKYDPTAYVGQWSQYLDAWDLIHEAVRTAARLWQPPLFDFSSLKGAEHGL